MRSDSSRSGLLSYICVALTVAASACAAAGTSWQEEVLLHDGRTIVVERSQTYGGRHEVGQEPPIKELHLSFKLPSSGRIVSWTSEYGEDLGLTNFKLLALHLSGDVPYVVTTPSLCLSYNKWGRPNPPYVVFRLDGAEWRRIDLKELPAGFKTLNLVIDTLGHKSTLDQTPFVPAALVASLNRRLEHPEYLGLLRTPLPPGQVSSAVNCAVLVPSGRGGWLGLDWFTTQPSLEKCLTVCRLQRMNDSVCPCKRLFEGKRDDK